THVKQKLRALSRERRRCSRKEFFGLVEISLCFTHTPKMKIADWITSAITIHNHLKISARLVVPLQTQQRKTQFKICRGKVAALPHEQTLVAIDGVQGVSLFVGAASAL